MSEYLEVYEARANRNGKTHKEVQLNSSIKEFDRYLEGHPSSEEIVFEGEEELASIINHKQNENRTGKLFLTRLTSSIGSGDKIYWRNQPWLIYQQTEEPNEAYKKNFGLKCNEVLKWVDDNGLFNRVDCYLVGPMDAKIKESFRTSSQIVVPQTNMDIRVMTQSEPRLQLGMRFILGDRAWRITDMDRLSVKGIDYMSMVEDKIDEGDDVKGDIKVINIAKLNSVFIEVPEEILIQPDITATLTPKLKHKNGTYFTGSTFSATSESDKIAITSLDEGRMLGITAAEEGEYPIRIASLDRDDRLYVRMNVKVNAEAPTSEPVFIIAGPDSIKVTTDALYSVVEVMPNGEQQEFPVIDCLTDDTRLATVEKDGLNMIVMANKKNKLGVVDLTASIMKGDEPFMVVKTITIKPLW